MRLRLGLIGQGSDWTSRYQPSLRLMVDRFELKGVYCSVAMLAEQVARDFHADVEQSYRSLIQREDIDAILMLESDWYGLLPLQAACEFGKAVFCGSSVDLAPSSALELRELVEQSGIAFMIELPRRFAPATLRLKELLATRLGKPRLLFCHRRLPMENVDHRLSRLAAQRSQHELFELIDWCCYLVDREPTWTQGIRHPSTFDLNTSDYQVLSVGFGNPEKEVDSVLAQVSCGSYMPVGWQEAIAFRPPAAIQVCCEKGIAFVDLPSTLIWFDNAGRHQEVLDTELSVGQQLFGQFHRAVTSLVRKMGDLDDTYRALKILEAANESMVSQRRESLQFVPFES